MANILFKISFTHLCWGIKQSSLSEDYEKEISVQEGEKFNLKYQKASVLVLNQSTLILRKRRGDGFCDAAQFHLEKGVETKIEFEEDYEAFSDCIMGVFVGSVLLK